MAEPESSLGFSQHYLRSHEYCMSEELTREERGVVLDHIEKLIDTRGPEWSFNRSAGPDVVVAQIGGVELRFHVYGPTAIMQMTRPAAIQLYAPHYPPTQGYEARIRTLVDKLHHLRHMNGNHLTRALETVGINFAPVRQAAHQLTVTIDSSVFNNQAPPAFAQAEQPLSAEERGVEEIQASLDRTAANKTRRVQRAGAAVFMLGAMVIVGHVLFTL